MTTGCSAPAREDKAEGFGGEGLPAISLGTGERSQRYLDNNNSSRADPEKTLLERS